MTTGDDELIATLNAGAELTPARRDAIIFCRTGCGARVAESGARCNPCTRKRWVVALEKSVPARFRWALHDDARALLEERVQLDRSKLEAILRWPATLVAHPPSIVFVGPPGVGKTSLVIALLAACVRSARALDADLVRSIRFDAAYELARARARHPLGVGEAPPIIAATNASLLVLDDVGGEDDAHASVIDHVIRARHDADLPLLATTGLEPEQVAKRYDGAIARRLYEGAKIVRFGAEASA